MASHTVNPSGSPASSFLSFETDTDNSYLPDSRPARHTVGLPIRLTAEYTEEAQELECGWPADRAVPFDTTDLHHVRVQWPCAAGPDTPGLRRRFEVACSPGCSRCNNGAYIAEDRLIRLFGGALPPAQLLAPHTDSMRV